ncbi:ABC transporter ATP-binding protein [Pontivivens insulae]|uniref:Daunorubicin/doxorubicin resistance ATP-binding protein DrrA n=1 Tax=Pontivivens insulae TaxID=1639689 RepID=A0A2R8AEV0_9RHOB|nr:ABC transporter ATP-binding protein [Pontivivens insulae]RED11871.1 ABC-2 type transport system ATP-binding protein [Pontivivens insulae]SPF30628.1 Daunorubicin/doxorubicin resistance ATP-binding protein DrrA [Pontivivens insulae]
MAENAIELVGLRKVYRAQGTGVEKVAVKDLHLGIPKGSIFGLLGPNGAGKSTTINIMAGLVNKTAGTVKIWGFDQDKNPRMSRASIGVVPQELNVDPFFSPRAALEVQAGLYGVPPEHRRTEMILEKVGLLDKAEAYARTLSGGMRRRLLVAKALVHAPQVLVLDEPTAGVDIELRQMLWDYVRELNAAGTTIILTTHYLEEAQEMCDRIGIIADGTLVACDETPNLLGRLDTKTLVVTPDTASTLPELPPQVDGETREDGALILRYPKSVYTAMDLLDHLRAKGVTIRDMATEEPNLEDVFRNITQAA